MNPKLLDVEGLSVVYTITRRLGLSCRKALEQAEFKGLHVVEEQAVPDGAITVKSSNPEETKAHLNMR